MSTAARILIFDSGVGGLSILQEIQQQYPHCQFFYASDNAAFPYGTKSEQELIDRVDHVLHRLQERSQADMMVIACNSASTVALPRIRERFAQPVIGVVPAIKPAASLSQSKCIGLLATPGTVKREYTQDLINDFASDCKVISIGSSKLVQLAEDKLRGQRISQSELAPIVAAFAEQPELDTLVLACTHFPLLKEELMLSLPQVTHWVDSGQAIARRVGYWIDALSLSLGESASPGLAYFTQEDQYTQQLEQPLKTLGIQTIEYL